jgi:hypothetical protein
LDQEIRDLEAIHQ